MKKILFATLLLSATFGLLGSCSKGEAVVAAPVPVNCEAKAKKVSDLAVAYVSDLLNKTKCQDYLNAGYDFLKSCPTANSADLKKALDDIAAKCK
jgi:hypothetical protein